MPDTSPYLIVLIFVLAGLVKGLTGLGLPTVSVGLLAVTMPPAHAAAIVVIPSLLTNIYQAVSGPYLTRLSRRTGTMLVGVCVGTWAGIGVMLAISAQSGSLLLGLVLSVYAAAGIMRREFSLAADFERWLGPVVGFATGLITVATGVFVMPVVPYLQALGLDKDELVQALGISFTVSALALMVNLGALGILQTVSLYTSVAALSAATVGMWAGQRLRQKLSPDRFRLLFYWALMMLGAYLVLLSLH